MNQPTLVQELETAKILQQLSQQQPFVPNSSTPSAPAPQRQQQQPRNPAVSLKRKLWATDYSATTTKTTSESPRTLSSTFVRRSVSPATDTDSVAEISLCASFSSDQDRFLNSKIKPLSPPPKLMMVSLPRSRLPTSSSARFHSSTQGSTSNINIAPMPIDSNSANLGGMSMMGLPCNSARLDANLDGMLTLSDSMILQLINNPMVYAGNVVPRMCYPAQMNHMSLLQGDINILPKASAPITPTALESSTEVLDDADAKKKRKICRMDDCNDEAARRTPYCKNHCGQRKCEKSGCQKCAQGRTRFCIAHGGGRRCQFEGCAKGARDKHFCASHGGGRRCNVGPCTKLAVGKGFTCTAHGGGRRCLHDTCSKSAQSSSSYCVRHGGGRKCRAVNCSKVARGKIGLCMSHATQQEI